MKITDAEVDPDTTHCIICGAIVNTAEDGGAGCQLTSGLWTCSERCWDRAVEMANQQSGLDPDEKTSTQD